MQSSTPIPDQADGLRAAFAPSDDLAVLRNEWQIFTVAMRDRHFELTVDEFAAVLSVYKQLRLAGETFDPMVAALMAVLERQAAETIDGFEDDTDSDEDGADEGLEHDESHDDRGTNVDYECASERTRKEFVSEAPQRKMMAKCRRAEIAQAFGLLPTVTNYQRRDVAVNGGAFGEDVIDEGENDEAYIDHGGRFDDDEPEPEDKGGR